MHYIVEEVRNNFDGSSQGRTISFTDEQSAVEYAQALLDYDVVDDVDMYEVDPWGFTHYYGDDQY
jgi:hypothetical protein